MQADRYGVFTTTSYYPPESGHMSMHKDGVGGNFPLIHHVLPLTHKGIDYSAGGLAVIDRHDNRTDIDAAMNPGDVIFYDASLEHGVDPIGASLTSPPIGRLQMFAIPSRFNSPEVNMDTIRRVSLKDFLHSRYLKTKNRLSILLRQRPILR